jgi:chitodextrinase
MRKSKAIAVLFSLASAFALAVGFTPAAIGKATRAHTDSISPSSASGSKFTATADAYVSASKPRANYGSSNRLKSESSPTLESFVRFDGGNISGQITRATLWLYAVNGSNVGYAVHPVSGLWHEDTISYINAPAISASAVNSPSSYPSNSWMTLDVTQFVSATGAANLAVTSQSMSALSLASRESGGKAPVLVIQTTNPDTSPPSAPTGLAVGTPGATSISFSWSAASDNVGVAGYGVYRNGGLVDSTQQTTYTMSSLTCGTNYSVGVDAFDATGNRSAQTTVLVTTAACPDTVAPTAPTALTVTSASATGISLRWTQSSDNVSVAGYNVFLNGTKTTTTTSTSYSFAGLTCGTSYTLGVQAYDAAGNRSTQASIVAPTSPCVDGSAPLAPTGLLVTAATSTSISALWNPSFDNVAVTGYHVYVNGSRIGSTQLTNYTFGSLTCGTSYTIGVDAYDASGNTSTQTSVTAATAACSVPGPGPAPQPGAPKYRYIYNSGSDTAIAQDGWNLYDVSSKSVADALPAGTQSLYWVGDYNNSTCSWEMSDSAVTSEVQQMVGDSKIFGYFISDEPNPYACPNAPAQHKARTALIHSIDPAKQVVIVLDSNGFSGRATQDALDQIPLWKGTADVIGLDPYPCYQGGACDYTWIDRTIAAADAAGIPYWGVVQAFDDSSWRWPTAAEEQHMLTQWGNSHEGGYMTFAWTWAGNNLSSQPALLDTLKQFNSGTSGGSTSPPADTSPPSAPAGLSISSATTTSVALAWTASTDNVGVTGYHVYRDGALAGTSPSAGYTFTGLNCGTSYTFSVDAYDAAGNRSGQASVVAATAKCTDSVAPTTPTNLKATGATTTSVSFSWSGSTDNVGVAGYGIYRAGTRVATTTAANYTLSGLSCGTSYSLGVDAYDAAGNRSPQASLTIATSPCDTTPPSPPGTPSVTIATQSSIAIMWSSSLDNVGVAGYDVFSNGTKVGSVTGTSYTFNGLTCGTSYTLGVEAYDAAGNHSTRATVGGATSACSTPPPPPPPSSSDPVVTAAGDICGSPTDCAPTAALLDSIGPTRVLTLGDNAYADGTSSEYANYYDPNWGRKKSITSPAPGNHDYHTSGGAGYFGYFGSQAPAPYYSFNLGSWHLISLDGEIDVSAGSAQETWLKSDLAANAGKCTLAYWHEPRFSSGAEHGSDSGFDPFWRDLYAAGADIVLNGHDHEYERFAPQNPSGAPDPKGIREFVVGTGGSSHYNFASPVSNSEVRDNTSFGVLKLTLHPGSYDWQFVPIAGASFTDSGSGSC